MFSIPSIERITVHTEVSQWEIIFSFLNTRPAFIGLAGHYDFSWKALRQFLTTSWFTPSISMNVQWAIQATIFWLIFSSFSFQLKRSFLSAYSYFLWDVFFLLLLFFVSHSAEIQFSWSNFSIHIMVSSLLTSWRRVGKLALGSWMCLFTAALNVGLAYPSIWLGWYSFNHPWYCILH